MGFGPSGSTMRQGGVGQGKGEGGGEGGGWGEGVSDLNSLAPTPSGLQAHAPNRPSAGTSPGAIANRRGSGGGGVGGGGVRGREGVGVGVVEEKNSGNEYIDFFPLQGWGGGGGGGDDYPPCS